VSARYRADTGRIKRERVLAPRFFLGQGELDSLDRMTESDRSISSGVVIVGGGVAGLEALLALRALLGDRVTLTLVSQDDVFVDRPMTVAEPFGFGPAPHYSLPEIAAESGAQFVRATVAAVDAAEHRVRSADGAEVGFETLILAPGARMTVTSPDAITFGVAGSGAAMEEMLTRLRSGEGRSATFVAPSMTGWLLPLYELALMTARDLAHHHVEGVHLSLVTSETRPLAVFGEQGSQKLARLLEAAGIEFIGAAGGTQETLVGASADAVGTDYFVTLPVLRGPGIDGLPTTEDQRFIPVDEYGKVEGLADIHAAGDAVNFPIKQGGLAAQLADSVAEYVAARHGATVEPSPFRPVLRGMLFTGDEPQFMRSRVPSADGESASAWYPLWWPPTKVAGRYLAPYLFGRDQVEGAAPHPEAFMDVDIPLTAAPLPG
jgi:sulfide:quinone oxidoreductase